jgi:hypothetical protein
MIALGRAGNGQTTSPANKAVDLILLDQFTYDCADEVRSLIFQADCLQHTFIYNAFEKRFDLLM